MQCAGGSPAKGGAPSHTAGASSALSVPSAPVVPAGDALVARHKVVGQLLIPMHVCSQTPHSAGRGGRRAYVSVFSTRRHGRGTHTGLSRGGSQSPGPGRRPHRCLRRAVAVTLCAHTHEPLCTVLASTTHPQTGRSPPPPSPCARSRPAAREESAEQALFALPAALRDGLPGRLPRKNTAPGCVGAF